MSLSHRNFEIVLSATEPAVAEVRLFGVSIVRGLTENQAALVATLLSWSLSKRARAWMWQAPD